MLAHQLRRATPKRQRPSYVGGVAAGRYTATTPAGSVSVDLTSLTGGIASAPAAGDLVVAAFASGGGSATDFTMAMTTSGYTTVADLRSADSYYINLGVFYKVMESTPDTTAQAGATADVNCRVLAVQVWRGVDPTTPLDVTSMTATGANSGIPNAPGITPSTPLSVVIAAGAACGYILSPYLEVLTVPSGMANVSASISSTGSANLATAALASYDWVSGAYDPAAFGGGTSSVYCAWAAATLALRPA